MTNPPRPSLHAHSSASGSGSTIRPSSSPSCSLASSHRHSPAAYPSPHFLLASRSSSSLGSLASANSSRSLTSPSDGASSSSVMDRSQGSGASALSGHTEVVPIASGSWADPQQAVTEAAQAEGPESMGPSGLVRSPLYSLEPPPQALSSLSSPALSHLAAGHALGHTPASHSAHGVPDLSAGPVLEPPVFASAMRASSSAPGGSLPPSLKAVSLSASLCAPEPPSLPFAGLKGKHLSLSSLGAAAASQHPGLASPCSPRSCASFPMASTPHAQSSLNGTRWEEGGWCGPEGKGPTPWIRDTNAASFRRCSASSSAPSLASSAPSAWSFNSRWSARSGSSGGVGSRSSAATSLWSVRQAGSVSGYASSNGGLRSDVFCEESDGTAEGNGKAIEDRHRWGLEEQPEPAEEDGCLVEMPASPPSRPLPQNPPAVSQVAVQETDTEFIITIYLPSFSPELITVSRRRSHAVHIVADLHAGPNAGHFERLIQLSGGQSDAGPSSHVKAEYSGDNEELKVTVLKRGTAKKVKAQKEAEAAAAASASASAASEPEPPGAVGKECPAKTKEGGGLRGWARGVGKKKVLEAREKARRQAEEWARLGMS